MSSKIEDLKELISMVIEITDCTYVAYADGKLDWTDISHMWGVIQKIGPAVAGIDNVPAELSDLTAEECDELIALVGEELTTPTEHSKIVVEKCLKALKASYEAYLAIRG